MLPVSFSESGEIENRGNKKTGELAGQKDGPGQLWVAWFALRYKPGSRGDGRHWPGPDVRDNLFRAISYETTTSSCPDWCLPSPLRIKLSSI